MARKRTAILISGRGSNMSALLDAAADPGYPAEIVLVLSNKADAKGLTVAADHGIETAVVSHKDHADRPGFDAAVQAALDAAAIELVCLAGFMRLLTPDFVTAWSGRMLNIHPSLLPAFKGLDTHARVLDAGVRITGCTVHFVVPEMDAGPIVAQAAVPVRAEDTADTLAARVLSQEHTLYPRALRWLAQGRLSLNGDRAILTDDTRTARAVVMPPGPP